MRSTGDEVAPGVYRLGDRRVNWWLVIDGGAAVVIDAGLPAHYPQLGSLIEQVGLDASCIKAVLVTHGHADHLACIPRLRADVGDDLPVLIGAADRPLAASRPKVPAKMLRNSWRPAAIATAVAYARQDVRSVRRVAGTQPLVDGEVLDLPGSLRFLSAPGHTHGSGMFLTPSGVLFTGDVLVTLDPFTGRTGPRTLPAFDNVDHAQALRALDVVESSGATLLLPGHGAPHSGTAAAAARAAKAA